MSFAASQPTQVLSAIATTVGVSVPVCPSYRIVNTSTTLIVHVLMGVGTVSAVMPIVGTPSAGVTLAPNSSIILEAPQGTNYVAAIASGAGPTLVYITPGYGSLT